MISDETRPAVLVLGGAGDMGSRAVEALAHGGAVGRITVADLDLPAARRLAQRCATPHSEVRPLGLDATDHAAVVRAMAGHQVAASALGPFHLFEQPMARAALEAGVPYASICDEWQPTEALLRMEPEARASGVLLLTGLGASPGITNLGVRHLADTMDSVSEAKVSVYLPMDAGGGPAVYQHLCHIVSGAVPCWRGGRRVDIKACTEDERVFFPRFGAHRIWNMGHPEPLTLPRFIPGLEAVSFAMGFGRGTSVLAALARRGALGHRSPLPRLARHIPASAAGARSAGAVRIDAAGHRDGRPTRRLLCGVADMREATGLGLAVGAQMLARGEVTVSGGGVFAPEGCLEPKPFFQSLADLGLPVYGDLELSHPLW